MSTPQCQHICLYSSDLAATHAFWTDIVGL
ncbi:MAG: VOC family protein [Nocardioides sp.]